MSLETCTGNRDHIPWHPRIAFSGTSCPVCLLMKLPAESLMRELTFLGDGVYASYDGYYIVLVTHDGFAREEPYANTILLNPEVFQNLLQYGQTLQ